MSSSRRLGFILVLFLLPLFAGFVPRAPNAHKSSHDPKGNRADSREQAYARELILEGKEIFRLDTFGDEAFWGGTLRLHEAVRELTPEQVLGLGLKIDSQALSPSTVQALERGRVDLDDTDVTLLLLRSNAVIGVTGFFTGNELTSIGIQCALCHSTVDDSVIPSVGRRLDGWANRDLNVGAIIAAAPDLSLIAGLLGKDEDAVRDVLRGWGPGKFDAQLLLDGKTENEEGGPAATLIPAAFGLAGHNQHTWTGAWGTVTYWNALVANLEMRGQGVFYDPRLDDPEQYPIAAANPELFGHKRDPVDRISSKLPALHLYQLSLPAPAPPPGSFNAAAARRGRTLFSGKAACASCHVLPMTTEPGWNLHPADDICIDSFQADRAPDHVYRTANLNGLWTHQEGGFYHDGRFATLAEVVEHYDGCLDLHLTGGEINDLVEYLKSLPDEETSGLEP